jgi:hypothetical protein
MLMQPFFLGAVSGRFYKITMKKIAMYDLEGHLLEVFETNTIVELENMLDVSQGGINACLSGKALSTKNFQFKEIFSKPLTKIGDVSRITIGQSNKPVSKYYNGNFICSYSNIKEASVINNINISGISRCCNKKQKIAGRFEWRWAV